MQTILLTLAFNKVSPVLFRQTIEEIRQAHPFFNDNLELKSDYSSHECWLSQDGNCGFAVAPDCELLNVFSRFTGQGTATVNFAKGKYPWLHLNCYADGFLQGFYQNLGFEPVRYEQNWEEGGPRVVFMQLNAK